MNTGDDVQLVLFRAGAYHFALDIFQVERILRYQVPTPLPDSPEFLEGTIRYADGVVPLMDLRKRLGLPAETRDEIRIMMLEWDGGKLGVVVDQVLEILRIPAEAITPPPRIVRGLAAEYINGLFTLGDRTIVILAVGKLLSSAERIQLDEVFEGAQHG